MISLNSYYILLGTELLILIILFLRGKNIFKKSHSDFLTITWISCVLAIILTILYGMHVVVTEETHPMEFPYSKIDGIISLGFILAVIGTIWAVWARIDAHEAFKGTNKILDALGNSFEFPDILNDDKYLYVLKKIPSNNTTVSFYLGFPCIGLLYRDAKYEFKNLLPKESIMLLTGEINALQSHLKNVKDNNVIKNFKLNICVIDEEEAITIMKQKIPEEKHCEKEIRKFYKACEEAKELSNIGNRININFLTNFTSNEKLRFITVNTGEGKQVENKAFVWIADISKSGQDSNANTNYTTFDSKGFQTNDSKFISVLESVFD